MKKVLINTMSLMLVSILFLSSCAKDEIKREVKKAQDNDGNTYSVLIEEDGFLKLGEKDELVIKDDEGLTESISFPRTLTVEDEIHTKFYKIKLPSGWTDESGEIIKIRHEENSKFTEIIINERASSLKECKDEIESIMEPLEKESHETVKFSFATAEKLEFENSIIFYVFTYDERTYFIRVRTNEDKINYEEIIDTIQFRKGE